MCVVGGKGGHRKAVVVLTSGRRGELRDRVERVRRRHVVARASRRARLGAPSAASACVHACARPVVLGAAGEAGRAGWAGACCAWGEGGGELLRQRAGGRGRGAGHGGGLLCSVRGEGRKGGEGGKKEKGGKMEQEKEKEKERERKRESERAGDIRGGDRGAGRPRALRRPVGRRRTRSEEK